MTPLVERRKDGMIRPEDEVRRLLRRSMKESSSDRAVIAQRMTELLGRPITLSMLADFTRNARLKKKRQVRFPAAWIPAFCTVTGDDELQRHLLSDRLRSLLAIGEGIEESEKGLEKAETELQKLKQAVPQKKRSPR